MRVERDQSRVLVILGGMGLIFVVGLWLPMKFHEANLRAAIAASEEGPGPDGTEVHRLSDLAKEVTGLNRVFEGRQRYVPQEAELGDLLKSISGDLASLGVTDVETQTQPTVAGADYTVIPVAMRFRAPVPAVFALLSRIESMRRLVRITRLEVSGAHGGADKDKAGLSVAVELCTFYSPTEAKTP